MRITAVSHADMGRQLLDEMARYRYDVFVRTLGWHLDCSEGRELDKFDQPHAQYLLMRGTDGQLCGCARLLPTTQPYLLRDVFPMLVAGPTPVDPAVWELSRFVAMDRSGSASGPSALRQFSSAGAVNLLQTAIATARGLGATRLVTVSPLGVERLLARAGFAAARLSPPCTVDGRRLFACLIDCRTASLAPSHAVPRQALAA